MMKFQNIYCLFAIAALFMLSSCGTIIRSHIRNDAENIPADFGKERITLLVIQERKGYNKQVEKIFKDHYTGNYAFVTREELENKYSDTVGYRYVLDDDIAVSKWRVTTITKDRKTGFEKRTTEPRSTASRSFHILDRKENTIHDTGVSSGTSWKKILKAYLQKLDTERKKNGGN